MNSTVHILSEIEHIHYRAQPTILVLQTTQGIGSNFKLGGGGHKLSGALFDTEMAPSNMIWMLNI